MKNLWFIGVILISLGVHGQDIPLGTWRTHFSYSRVLEVEETTSRIFAASDVGLFSVEKSSGEIVKYSTLDGLQGVDISVLAFDPSGSRLLIGYRSGNMDIIENGEIVNVDFTTNSQVVGSRAVNAIEIVGELAFIGTDYGILDFDLSAKNVRATYREIGSLASQVAVRDLAVYSDSLVAVTPDGWQAVALAGVDPADYKNWKRNTLPEELKKVTTTGGVLYFQSSDTIYKYVGGQSQAFLQEGLYKGIDTYNGQLLVFSFAKAEVVDETGQVLDEISESPITEVRDGLLDQSGNWWIADSRAGLLSDRDGALSSFSPSGPVQSNMFGLRYSRGELIAFPGGYSSQVLPLNNSLGYSVFRSGIWENMGYPGFTDITDGVNAPEATYLASSGKGLLQVSEGSVVLYNDTNSPLVPARDSDIIIPQLVSANAGLFMLNYLSATPLLSFNGESWTAYPFLPVIARSALSFTLASGVAWLIIPPARGGGMLGYNLSDATSRYISEQTDQGSLASRNVFAAATDRDGFLWIGTARGVSLLFNPGNLDGSINAVEPVFDGRPLLVDREVYAIAVDGGNRKWMGTDEGAWLFDPLADNLIVHFTTQNSPLPSDVILDIAIDDVSGEVFFLTEAGIASFRSDATESEGKHEDVKVFPNPVLRTFRGDVAISGLARDAIVKITDISGRLIYQTQANGGTATWPVRARSNTTGIYLVFSASADGEESYVGKIAVIN
ncbi:T9SS type A sorting domain-containing protein [Fulvivirga sedimenti]|uniref:PorZ N-terminal beta-propeller domain-containing protein n=1 Tax=Fulvivirga sedimenti TaxID=2879465 RepID=A0A9X1HNE7_9BACT|nr:two-component regulator propeller domain-containing protein [Fulvivirga sedimenti]MCA6074215.1 hypothetical protein [Fulvivirga sedimenti]